MTGDAKNLLRNIDSMNKALNILVCRDVIVAMIVDFKLLKLKRIYKFVCHNFIDIKLQIKEN